MRLASEAMRPHVVSFLDAMLRDRTSTTRIEEIVVSARSPWNGRSLGGLDLRGRYGLTALALREGSEGAFRYGPGPDETMGPDAVLVVLGEVGRIRNARDEAAPA